MKPTNDGNLVISYPDFPEMDAFVASEAEAEVFGADAVLEAVLQRMCKGQDVPLPSDRPGAGATLHPSDYEAIERYRAARLAD